MGKNKTMATGGKGSGAKIRVGGNTVKAGTAGTGAVRKGGKSR